MAEYYEGAAQDLVDAHAKLERSPLVLAVRYHLAGDLDPLKLSAVQKHLLKLLEVPQALYE